MSYFVNRKKQHIAFLLILLIVFLPSARLIGAEELEPVVAEEENLSAEALVPKKSSKDLELIDFANGLFQRNFYDMALSEYKKFVASYPDSDYLDDAYFGIAESLFFLKSYQKAIGAFNSYKEFYPQGEKIFISNFRLGQSFFYIDDFDNALIHLNQVDINKLEKEFIPAFYFYEGKILSKQKKAKEAYDALEKVIKTDPPNDYVFLAYVELAELSNESEDYVHAIDFYQKAYASTKEEERKAISLYKQGEIYILIKRHKEAVKTFQEVMKKYPQTDIAFDAFSNLLVSLYNLEEYESLLSMYEAHRKEFAGKDAAKLFKLYYILATAHVQLGNFIGALTVLDDALSLEGLSPDEVHKALIKKTEILVKIQKFDIALSILTDQLAESALEPDNLLFLKAESLYGMGNYQEAFELYQEIRTKYPQSSLNDESLYSMAHAKSKLTHLTEAADLFLNYFETGQDIHKKEEALYNLILIERDLQDLKKTIQYAETFVATFRESVKQERILFLLGTLYQQNKEYAKAVEVNKTFMAMYPQSERLHEIYFLFAFNLQSLGSNEEALKYYEKLNAQEIPRNLRYPALKNSALIYLNQDNKEKAVAAFDEIIALYEENDLQLDTYIWIAEYYYDKKQFENMLSIVEKAEIKVAGQENEKVVQIAFLKAQALMNEGRIEKAIKKYQEVLADESDLLFKAASRIGLGLCYVEKKMYEKAKSEFETAILENTEDNTITMRARFEIANMYWNLHEYEEAIKFYMFVSVLYDDEQYCATALYRAGQAFEKVERLHEALKVYDELTIRYPGSEYYPKAVERIEALDAI